MDRTARLYHLQCLFLQRPAGYRSAELAAICGVDHRTINRDLQALQDEPYRLPLVQEGWTWRLMDDHRFVLPPVYLSLQEAVALYLAARLLDRASDEPNPFVGRALLALAHALPPEVGQRVQRLAETRLRDEHSPFGQVFQALSQGWAAGRKVRIRYRSIGSENVHTYVLCPYLIEPLGTEPAAYVIGHATYFDAVRTFKLERILEAEVLDEAFCVPADFDGRALLDSAWGVMFGEETTTVLLRFAPEVTRRVKEASWHGTQQVEDLPDGGCLLRVRVAHPVEMRRWVLAWGAACEVLAPAWLREEVAREARAMVGVYGKG